MLLSNLHTHTTFSDGKNTVEENILTAIDKGFVSLGISDHSYTDFDLTYCMTREAEYLAEVKAMAEKYRDRLEVYRGIELDGYSEMPERDTYDYIIGSCHYIRTPDGYFSIDHCREGHMELFERYFDLDPYSFARAYFDTYVERTLAHRPDILGHFDLVAKFGMMPETDEKYLSLAREALEVCLKAVPIIEINVGTMARGIRSCPYPAPYFMKDIKAFGGRVTFSTDCHQRDNLDYAVKEIEELFRENGFKSAVILKNGKFEETEI